MKKAFRKIHLWLSVPFGVIITLICFSGAMLVFENEIMQMTHRHLYYVEKSGKTYPYGTTGGEGFHHPARRCESNRHYRLPRPPKSLSNQSVKTETYFDLYRPIYRRNQGQKPTLPVFQSHVFVTSLATGQPSRRRQGILGKTIVGISTLMFIFVLVSGIIIWWPRTRKALKNSLK